MPLAAGDAFGSYEILSALGAGGMGEVYRARDTTLGREVAVKVLPDEFAGQPDRLARFEREARLLAGLNHPGIATLYGVEQVEGRLLLAMELVEGETLAERISRGAVPAGEALPIARQIAEALEAAHEKGVVHRDLKPANVKVDADGRVKVLDFGLAKAFADEGPESDSSQSPTLSHASTQAGLILGTAAYMSPEQAKGKAVDRRSDVFSFGAVLYEMLAGRKAFGGEDVPEILASVINREPDWTALPPGVDRRLEALLRRCLRKDRRARRQSIGDVRVDLDEISSGPEEVPKRPARALAVPVAAVAGAALAALVAVTLRTPAPPRPVIRMIATAPSAEELGRRFNDAEIAISPDGTRIVYPARSNGERQFVVRSLDRLEPTALPGLGALPRGPFFSPDGEWIGYFDRRALRKVSVQGGAPVNVCELPGTSPPRGGSWGPDGTIVFATSDASTGLWQVSAAGGEPRPLTTPEPGQGDHLWPEVLPGGQGVLFAISDAATGQLRIAALNLATSAVGVLIPDGGNPRYASTGHIVYGVDGALRAVRFDAGRLALEGDPVPVLDGVITLREGAAQFGLSHDGSLLYLSGSAETGDERTLSWVYRDGAEEALATRPRRYYSPRVSPDGGAVALGARDQQRDVWIWEESGGLRRLTFGSDRDTTPIWTPDGRRLVFGRGSAPTGSARNLFWKAADGSGSAARLTQSENDQVPCSFSPDGGFLVYRESHPERGYDLYRLSMGEAGTSEPLFTGPYDELNAEVSPDGRWLAYESNETGEAEIYLRPYPNVDGGQWPLSRGPGTQPVWARNGRELFYFNGDGQLMSVAVSSDAGPSFGVPELVLEESYRWTAAPDRSYDVSPDGRRFLMIRPYTSADERLILVQNWREELTRLVPMD